MQKKFDSLGLKDGLGKKPVVLEVVKLDRHRQKVILTTGGVGLDRFRAKESDLESALGKIVQSMELSKSLQTVEVNLSTRRIPTVVKYHDLVDGVKKPFSFIVGETMDGPVYCTIDELPHLLVAGITNSGKSVFLANLCISILESSDRVKLFLLDLKRGTEFKEFEKLENVETAKNEQEAVNKLRKVKQEMERRFDFLERNSLKQIDPLKHGFDQIVVVVDEASVLYGKESAGSATKKLVDEARAITDNIVKVSRVTRISVVLATQKISKDTIQTKVQENMGAKICFRTSTLQNSMTVLGSPEAYKLPAVKGRAYWRYGHDLLEVQTPYMDDVTKEEELESLAEKYQSFNEKNTIAESDEEKEAKERILALQAFEQSEEE